MRRIAQTFAVVLLAMTLLPALAAAQFKRDAGSGLQDASARHPTGAPRQDVAGFGTRQQPFFVRQTDPGEAEAFQRDLLRTISRARGGFWRTISRNAESSTAGSRIEQVKVEFAYAQGPRFIRDTVNFYFDVTGVEQRAVPEPAIWTTARHAGLNVGLPAEVGWLHLQSSFDNERSFPGMGWTFAYGAPGIKATVYLYSRTVPSISGGPDSRVVRDEFEQSRRELNLVQSNARPIESPRPRGAFLTQTFKLEDDFTLLAVAAWQGHFLKLRLTHESGMVVTDMANESVDALLAFVQKETRDSK